MTLSVNYRDGNIYCNQKSETNDWCDARCSEICGQDHKTKWGDLKFVTGNNCVPQCAFIEMMTTKKHFRKTDGRQFYHFVQSLPEEDGLVPQEVNAIGLEFAAREFPDFEVVVAAHLDTGHLHNHLVVELRQLCGWQKATPECTSLSSRQRVGGAVTTACMTKLS